MSFISKNEGKGFEPGWFLFDDENCVRETMTISATGVTADNNGQKIVKGGTLYTKTENNTTVYVGFVYEDINVTSGDMPGSVVTKGNVYEDRLPATLASAAKTALEAKGFVFKTSPAVIRGDEN